MPQSDIPTLDVSRRWLVIQSPCSGWPGDRRGGRQAGFFRVIGHGVAQAESGAAFEMARRFFALPLAQKLAVSIDRSKHNRGYVGLGVEALDPKAGKDRKEAFNIGLELMADDPEVMEGMPFRGVNLWPDNPAFREEALGYFNAVWSLGRFLHRAIARDLSLNEDYFESRLDRPMATLRFASLSAGGWRGKGGCGRAYRLWQSDPAAD